MSAYLDASAILPFLIREPTSAKIDRYLAAATEPPVVSEFAVAEVASALSRLVRTRILAAADVDLAMSDFDAWRERATVDIDLQAADVRLASSFVRRFDLMLRAPDALHAAICRRADLLLVTLDRRLAAAAADLGVRTQLLE